MCVWKQRGNHWNSRNVSWWRENDRVGARACGVEQGGRISPSSYLWMAWRRGWCLEQMTWFLPISILFPQEMLPFHFRILKSFPRTFNSPYLRREPDGSMTFLLITKIVKQTAVKVSAVFFPSSELLCRFVSFLCHLPLQCLVYRRHTVMSGCSLKVLGLEDPLTLVNVVSGYRNAEEKRNYQMTYL